MISSYVLYDTYSELCLLPKIQTYSGILTSYSGIFSDIVAYLEPCLTLACSEPCHPVIFMTQDRTQFRTQNSVKSYSGIFRTLCIPRILRTLPYSELCDNENIPNYDVPNSYLGPETYSESCLFRHIQTYSDIFHNPRKTSFMIEKKVL